MKLFKEGWAWDPNRQDLGMTSRYSNCELEIIAYEIKTGQLVFRFMTM